MVSWNCKHFQHVKIYLPCNFEVNPITYFDRLCKLEKRGDEVKKKSSPQKPLGQLQPNFFGMILGWPPSKVGPVIPISNQDGRQAKNRKRGMKLKKIFSSETTEPISTKLCWYDPWVVPFQNCVRQCRPYPKWLPWLKLVISSNGQNCSIWSQKVPIFELYKHNDELFNIYYEIFYELWTFAYFDRLCKL